MAGAGAEADGGPEDRLLAGRYRVRGVLGRGGMGTVWLAVDEVLGREVAVKELRTYSDASGAELAELRVRMRREARAAARVRSGGVIAVHDVAEEDGRPLIVMELVDGPSLDDVLHERGTLDPRTAAGIGARVAEALAAAHAAGVLHRDVKPGNVLLERGGRVVLTDFGIATMDEPGDGTPSNLTKAGHLVGSLDFIAPERAQGMNPGPASDVWSLGAMLYAAVEGGSPFRRSAEWSTLAAIVTDELPEPVRAGAELGAVLRELMRKDPAARPDATRARVLLDAVAAGTPVPSASGGPVDPRVASPAPAGFGPAPAPYADPVTADPEPAASAVPPMPGGPESAQTAPDAETRPGPGWRPPRIAGGDGQGRPPRESRNRGRTAVIAAAAAVVLAGGGVAWSLVGGPGGSRSGTSPQAMPSIPGSLPSGSAGTGSPSHKAGSPSASASRSGAAAPSASGTTSSAPGSGSPAKPRSDGKPGTGKGGSSQGGAGAPSASAPDLPPPSSDAGYIPGSVASADGCVAWLDYKVSGSGGFAMGSVESSGNDCEMHFFRAYPSNTQSSQNLNSFHTTNGAQKLSTDWYWDGGGYYAGVCVWEAGHDNESNCGARYYVANGHLSSE
ncbi:serine/threonine protein kinase [Streptomyces sp. ICBB 8177]|uniref:serine/threonine-protein kinase n=1 Tax=Streptomyces sp. ICBB 8177 TaxID=563922 RepID=UPI0023AFCB97|nr:serine/threonine protein kinase [Streptomyces sp. ICBB 8177]